MMPTDVLLSPYPIVCSMASHDYGLMERACLVHIDYRLCVTSLSHDCNDDSDHYYDAAPHTAATYRKMYSLMGKLFGQVEVVDD
jgi:hypothetical protein